MSDQVYISTSGDDLNSSDSTNTYKSSDSSRSNYSTFQGTIKLEAIDMSLQTSIAPYTPVHLYIEALGQDRYQEYREQLDTIVWDCQNVAVAQKAANAIREMVQPHPILIKSHNAKAAFINQVKLGGLDVLVPILEVPEGFEEEEVAGEEDDETVDEENVLTILDIDVDDIAPEPSVPETTINDKEDTSIVEQDDVYNFSEDETVVHVSPEPSPILETQESFSPEPLDLVLEPTRQLLSCSDKMVLDQPSASTDGHVPSQPTPEPELVLSTVPNNLNQTVIFNSTVKFNGPVTFNGSVTFNGNVTFNGH